MSKKVKYTLEYPVRCSPGILYDFLSTPTGLQEWFADKVDERDGVFSFSWNGSSEEAEVMAREENKYIRKKVIRIDADDLRARMPGYTGNNSHLFQAAISIVVDRIQDLVLKQKQSFVLDGTLFDYDRAVKNFQRSIRRGRKVYIWYVYQNPEVAWRFTKAREEVEGRKIPREAFIKQFLGARDTVERIRKEFGEEVTVMLVKKDFEKHSVEKIAEIKQDGRQIDDYITERYTKDDLDKNI